VSPSSPIKPEPFRIEPIFAPRIWGAKSLAPIYPEKNNLTEPIGEAWLTGVDCKIATGPFAGKTLGEAWREMPSEWRGTGMPQSAEFPLLLKFIFPTEKLSIQVHPDDAYAAKHEAAAGGRGKTEMWHVVSAEPGARLLAGLKVGATKEKFTTALAAHTLEELFQSHEVDAGDTFFIPAGTPHTIGPGMIICEVQQYSDLTYRVYDYDRRDSKGNLRELHIEKALAVTKFVSRTNIKTVPLNAQVENMDICLLAACKYFAVFRWLFSRPFHSTWDSEGFKLFVVLSGKGKIAWKGGSSDFLPGECWLVPENLKPFSLLPEGPVNLLNVAVPHMSSLVEELELTSGYSASEISRTVFSED
jgi:mannose-6-phosphate isomerase